MTGVFENPLVSLLTLGLGGWMVTSSHVLILVVGCLLLARVAWVLLTLHGMVMIMARALVEKDQEPQQQD